MRLIDKFIEYVYKYIYNVVDIATFLLIELFRKQQPNTTQRTTRQLEKDFVLYPHPSSTRKVRGDKAGSLVSLGRWLETCCALSLFAFDMDYLRAVSTE